MKYKVFGDYGWKDEAALFEAEDLSSAISFAKNYTRHGDFGGYRIIEVIWFREDGELVNELELAAPQEE